MTICLALLLPNVLTYAQVDIVPDPSFSLPSQLTGVVIGMPLKSFLVVRHNVRNMLDDRTLYTLDPKLKDIGEIDITLVEEFDGTALYNFATYEFHQGHLVAVGFGNEFPDNVWKARSKDFLSSMIEKYGLPQHIGVTDLTIAHKPNIKIPILIWVKGEQSIVARFTPPDSTWGKQNIVDVFVGTNLIVQPDKWLEKFLPIGADEERQIVQPLLVIFGNLLPDKKDAFVVTKNPPLNLPATRPTTQIRIISRDYAPTWGETDSDIYFFTTRKISGEPIERKPESLEEVINATLLPRYKLAVATNDKASGLFHLTDLSHIPNFSRKSHRLAFVSDNSIYILDTKTLSLGRLNDGYRVFRGMPAWSNSGNEIASSGIHSLSDRTDKNYPYDDDIFVTKVTENLTIASGYSSWCPVRMSGKDILPIFSVDDQWIYFAHQKPIPLKKDDVAKDVSPTWPNWSIYRVKASKHFTENEPAEIILNDIPLPDRLSWFPDGNRLLVSFAQGGAFTESQIDLLRSPIVINTANKTTEKLKLQEMFDPTMPNGKALVPRSIALNVLGDRIVFYAYRWNKDQSGGVSCIYVSNLDGSQLQLVTDPDAPITFYKFADPTLNISNAWQNLLPKQNLGNPVATKYMNTVDGKPPKEEHEKAVQPAKK